MTTQIDRLNTDINRDKQIVRHMSLRVKPGVNKLEKLPNKPWLLTIDLEGMLRLIH